MNVMQQRMMDYTKLVAALRNNDWSDACPCCDEAMCKDADCIIFQAADAIEALQAQMPKRGEWNNHEVACLLAEMFGDDCACNLNGIDEWLPQYCEFAETCCPNPVGVACWEQFLKHRAKMEAQDG